MLRVNVIVLAVATTLACKRAARNDVAAVYHEPPALLVQASERVPPADATELFPKIYGKTLSRGMKGRLAQGQAPFSGYGWTFYSSDYRDTGTSLEMMSWEKTNAFERKLLHGRSPGEVIRVWDCSKTIEPSEPCRVDDYTVFGQPPDHV